ncbi:MAG TPA: hypothetical protein VMU16_15360 [Candidatus Binataceae bacterium]|nr:hypothetical protein [Candidatus Binataceae bacterium]
MKPEAKDECLLSIERFAHAIEMPDDFARRAANDLLLLNGRLGSCAVALAESAGIHEMPPQEQDGYDHPSQQIDGGVGEQLEVSQGPSPDRASQGNDYVDRKRNGNLLLRLVLHVPPALVQEGLFNGGRSVNAWFGANK